MLNVFVNAGAEHFDGAVWGDRMEVGRKRQEGSQGGWWVVGNAAEKRQAGDPFREAICAPDCGRDVLRWRERMKGRHD